MPGERTEQATQHRREKARKEGDILHSRELCGAAGTLAGVIALGVLGSQAMGAWRSAFSGFLSLGAAAHWEPATMEPTPGMHALRTSPVNATASVGVGELRPSRSPRRERAAIAPG